MSLSNDLWDERRGLHDDVLLDGDQSAPELRSVDDQLILNDLLALSVLCSYVDNAIAWRWR